MVNIQRVGQIIKPIVKILLKPQPKAKLQPFIGGNNEGGVVVITQAELQSKLQSKLQP